MFQRRTTREANSHSLLQTDLSKQIYCSTSTPPQCTNDQHLDPSRSTFNALQTVLHVLDHSLLIRIWLETSQRSVSSLSELRHKRQCTRCSSGETCVKSERRDSTLRLGVLEKLEIVQTAFAFCKSTEYGSPASLLLVAVCELDVGVGKRVAESLCSARIIRSHKHLRSFRKFLQSDDWDVQRGRWPFVMRYQRAADTIIQPYHQRNRHDHERVTYASNSASLNILWVSRSTKTSKLLSISCFAVVGVRAERCSYGFFSHRSQIDWRGCTSADVPAEVEEGLMSVSGAELAIASVCLLEKL